MNSNHLVTPEWLKENLENDKLKLIEAPWKPEAYPRAHIPGALCLPIDSYLKAENGNGELEKHVFGPEQFEALVKSLGIQEEDQVVVYDDYYCLFAARFWWVSHYFGFDNVKVLNGGWQAWVERGYPISINPETCPEGSNVKAQVRENAIIHMADLKERVAGGDLQIWDTRRLEEYDGTEETTNKRRGHIPASTHILWMDLLTEAEYEGGPRYIKSKEEIKSTLDSAGFRKDKLIVTHCQAAIRGAFGSFILSLLDYPTHKLYDGSMAEWANEDDTPLTLVD